VQRYIARRESRTIWKYGLLRRTQAVIQQLQRLSLSNSCVVLDIGTADGLLLRSLMEHYGLHRGIGLDVSFGYLKSAKENVPHAVQANGRRLPFGENSVEVIVSTAVFKMIRDLEDLVKECHRVLKPGGTLAVVDATPLGIHLGLLLGHFAKNSMAHIQSLKDTRQMLAKCGFTVFSAERFMLSPIPFPGCDALERALKRMHLDQLFFDQIVCAECSTC